MALSSSEKLKRETMSKDGMGDDRCNLGDRPLVLIRQSKPLGVDNARHAMPTCRSRGHRIRIKRHREDLDEYLLDIIDRCRLRTDQLLGEQFHLIRITLTDPPVLVKVHRIFELDCVTNQREQRIIGEAATKNVTSLCQTRSPHNPSTSPH